MSALMQQLARRSRSSLIAAVGRRSMSATNHWGDFAMGPPDPIIGLNEAYHKDDHPNKIIIGVGAYRCDEGKPYVLPCVMEAERIMTEKKLDMEYSGIAGDTLFLNLALKFGYGDDCVPLQENRIQGVQALSGTGGLRVMGELLHIHGHKHIYVPNPTWGNHIPIFQRSGLEVRKYRYYDAENSNLDFAGMLSDIQEMPARSCILLHACAHNPTGMDPNPEQWKQLSELIKAKELLPFFDNAYQGFASGNAEVDAASVRMFVNDGHHLAMVQSFSKNFGLYGHRVGALSIVGATEQEASSVVSQMKLVIRPMYSNPPRHGARIVSTILSDPLLSAAFREECQGMADRIKTMRALLRTRLEENGSLKGWEHVTDQIGMFAYSGMTKEQVAMLRDKHHIYCTMDGRISMAGVTSGNVDYIAEAIHDVTK